jgi:hypothetical protein
MLWLILAGAIIIMQLGGPAQIEIEWETETEFDTAGFNIYRSDSPEGDFLRINDRLIPSAADAAAGASYVFVDEHVERGKTYYYRLEDVEYSSARQQHEILSGRADTVAGWAIALAVISGMVGIALIASALKRKWNHGTESSTQAVA